MNANTYIDVVCQSRCLNWYGPICSVPWVMLHRPYIPRREAFQRTIVGSCPWVWSGKDRGKNTTPDENNGSSQKCDKLWKTEGKG